MTQLGKYIRQRRRSLDMTQKQLGERLNAMGVKRSEFAISNWETGRQPVPIDLIPAIAAALEEVSLAKWYDMAGVVDAFNAAELIRLLDGASPADIDYITKMAKTFFKHKSSE